MHDQIFRNTWDLGVSWFPHPWIRCTKDRGGPRGRQVGEREDWADDLPRSQVNPRYAWMSWSRYRSVFLFVLVCLHLTLYGCLVAGIDKDLPWGDVIKVRVIADAVFCEIVAGVVL